MLRVGKLKKQAVVNVGKHSGFTKPNKVLTKPQFTTIVAFQAFTSVGLLATMWRCT